MTSSLDSILGHPSLDIHRIEQRVHPLHVGSSGERRLRSFLSQCHLGLFQPSVLDFFTLLLYSITMNRQGTLARSDPEHLVKLASQDMGPVLTMLALYRRLEQGVPRRAYL